MIRPKNKKRKPKNRSKYALKLKVNSYTSTTLFE